MPLYEMIMVCRMAEQSAMSTLLRNVSKTILGEGGVVRGFTNMGDRVLTRNKQTEDGVHHGVGRFMQVQFYCSPSTLALAEVAARESQETLRVYSLKMRDDEYLKRLMGSLNAELSPFKDDETRDSHYMRQTLDHYRKFEDFEVSTSDRQIERNDVTVHSYLKQMEVGKNHTDAKLLRKLQEGEIERDNANFQKYLVKRLQNIPRAM
eukprot:Macronucleus_2358.p2 GENE.Macronucleus_2358~~Macronucleus_2358.p2  ORF type:complete len:207 (+),score=51.22 Macronucleus_2358:1-621(+)